MASDPQPPEQSETRTSLHQEVDFATNPESIYEALLDSKQFAAITGVPAEISPDVGGAFTMFGGMIEGRNIELVPAKRIVQAWRPKYWDPGQYSIVKFELVADGPNTKLILDHTGFPPDAYQGFWDGWPKRYWEPLAAYLAN